MDTMVIFDIDDTLYSELEFIWSSYESISEALHLNISSEMLGVRREWRNVFEYVKDKYKPLMTADEIADMYWLHTTTLHIYPDAKRLLDWLKANGYRMGIISDGRSITQRNKIAMLGLSDYIANDDIVISEEVGAMKPCIDNYMRFVNRYPDTKFIYIGDNTERDFLSPNRLGWDSFCRLDASQNIHSQDFSLPAEHMPRHRVRSLDECIDYLKKND